MQMSSTRDSAAETGSDWWAQLAGDPSSSPQTALSAKAGTWGQSESLGLGWGLGHPGLLLRSIRDEG